MAVGVSSQLQLNKFSVRRKHSGITDQPESSELRSWRHLRSQSISLSSSRASRQDLRSPNATDRIYRTLNYAPCRYNRFQCYCFGMPSFSDGIPLLKNTTLALSRSYNVLKESPLLSRSYTALAESPLVMQLAPAIGIIAFAVWGLGPLMHYGRTLFLHRSDSNWKKSKTHYVLTSYLQPLLLWTGTILLCRALGPVSLSSAASQAVKKRLLNFVQSLSTVLAFAYCLTRHTSLHDDNCQPLHAEHL
ncbi:uncharacterized protein A4U43_C03F30780 [Asparagus officinalis]|uniref:Mechanosensitive channel protein 2/3 transmembrane domain-containing protein n=1 Tax=Asparagus officinalis TaxID=4686 RepID=A0A5P1FE85_ASPOF|nr:uncharacterized protein A4U43_C03F30780 [Asparagus officinalis]